MAELSSYYYISPGSLSIVPNANGSPNDIAVSIASSASIMVFAPKIHNDLNWDGTNYKVWRLTAGNTRLGNEHADKVVYIYARLSRSAPTAEIIFTSARYTATAREETKTDNDGNPILDGEGNEVKETVYDEEYIKLSADGASFWVRIGMLTAPDGNNKRTLEYDSGQLGTPKGDEEKRSQGVEVMWVYDAVAKVMRAQVPIGAKNQGGDVRFVDPVRIDYTVRFGANGVQLNGVATSMGDNPTNASITSADDRLIATKGFSFAKFIKRAGDTLTDFFQYLGGMKISKGAGSADPALVVEGGAEADTLEVTGNTHTDSLDVEEDATVGGDLDVDGDTAVGGRLDVTGDAVAANLHAVHAGEYGNVTGKHIAATEDGHIGGDYVGVTVGNFTPSIDGIGGEGGGMIEIEEPLTDDEGNPRTDAQGRQLMGKFSSVDIDYLVVRRRAFFTNITVKELKHVGGEIILSPAAMICYAVEELKDAGAALVGWRCYFKASDTEGRKLNQEFEVGDQARCQMFDIDPGTSKYVSTRYYWRYVRGISVEPVELELERDGQTETVKCHYIDLSLNDRDPACSNVSKSGIPQPGDNISQLGNRSNIERQSAQILSAVGLYAPSHTYYQHINDYSLGTDKIVKQSNYDPTTGRMKDFVGDEFNYMRWTGTALQIKGDLSTSSGKNVDDVLTEHEREIRGLGVNMENVNAQADQRFQVWFDYDGIVPTLQNEPAVNWDTDELLQLHNQDIYYSCRILNDNGTPGDPSDDELSADGRAWRFDYTPAVKETQTQVNEETGEEEEVEVETTPARAEWVEITDQFALQGLRNAAIADRKAMTAQETVDRLADDNVLSAGSEKSRILAEWQQVVDEWTKYNEQASDHLTALAAAIAAEEDANVLAQLNSSNTALSAALNTYNAAWKHLAHYLDGDLDDDDEWDENWNHLVAPRWINADLEVDTPLSPIETGDTDYGGSARYREKWNDYYAALTALIKNVAVAAKALSNRAQATAESAVASIEAIAADGVLSVTELPDLRREFESAYREKNAEGGMIDLATVDGSSPRAYIDATLQAPTEAYEAAFAALAAYLNRGTAWAEPATYKSPLAASDFPTLLKVTDNVDFLDKWDGTGQRDDGRTFRNLWAALTASQVKLANAMATLNTNKADAAQETVDNLASDLILSAGREKAQLLVEWLDVTSAYGQYPAQAQDHLQWLSTTGDEGTLRASLSTAKTAFEAAVNNLGTFLNGGATWDGAAIPLFIRSENGGTYGEDTTMTAAQASNYRAMWTAYYSAFNTLLVLLTKAGKMKTEAAQSDATEALGKIDAIAQDGVLSVTELPDLRREFESAYREKNAEGGMIDLATVDGSSPRAYIDATLQAPTEAYEAAFATLAAYLNRGTAWAEPATYKSPLAASDFPTLLKVTDNVDFLDKWDGTGQRDDGRTFRNLWAALTASQVKLANAMATLNTNKADAAQETADNLADDGIISGGDEKLKLWIEWKRVLNERSHLIEQVADYNHATTGRLTIISTTTKILAATRTAATTLKANLSNAYASYEAALIGVGKYLDGVVSNGTYVEAQAGHFYNYAEDTVSWNNTPYVISDSQRAIDTKGISAVTYRSRWNAYYAALTTLYQYLSDAGALCVKASQDTANTALDRISAMVADGMINVSEKQDLRAEYVNVWNQMHCAGGIRDRARDANGNYLPATTIGGVSYNCLSLYNEWFQSFENLSEALNDGEQWDSRDLTTASDGTISASDPMLPYEINAEEGGLYEDWEVTDADAFRALWATLYQSTTKLETAIAKVTKYIADNAKAGVDNIFSNDVLTPEELRIIRREFHAMCIEWMNPNTGLYAQAKALEGTSDSGYEFDWGDWGELSELGSFLHNGVSWYLSEITITSSTVSESDTPDWIKTANLENTIDLSTAIVTVRNNWSWMASVLKDGNSWLSGRAALEKLWRLAQVETEALRKEIEEERAAQAKAGAISEAASADAAIRAAIAATIPKIFNYEKGVVTPTNYKVGDTWINVVAQPNAVALHDPTATASPYTKSMTLDKQALVCVSDYSGSFSWSDWQLLDQYLYASFKTNEDGLSSLAGRVTSAETTIRSHTTRIGQNADAISAVVTRTTTVEGKVSTLESAGFITSADWATLFAQKQTNGEVVSRAQITAMTDSIKLEVQGSVEEDINPGDNLLEYAELESMDELEDYWTLTTYGSTDQAAATAALNGSIITRAGVREGLFPILRVNMRQATLTAESGSPNVTIAQTIPTDVLQSFSGNTITLSVYLRKSTTYSDQLFGMFARNCANISVSEWTGDNVSMSHTNELIDNTTKTRYTQFNINDTEWHRLHIVITLSDKTVATEIFFRFWKSNNQSTGNMWYFSSPKLEAGSKPTRWIVEKSVIDITRNQIVLDSKTVKVARDLTIGGNAHIGGFIYNEPTILTVDKVRICCNPFDYGCLDRALAKAAYTDSAPYKTNNIVFPEFGSSVEITDAIGDVFTTANHRDRLQVMLPFWHFYNASSRNPMDYPSTIFADLNSKTWTEDSVTKSWSTMTDKTTKQLLSWIQSGYNICRQYIDTVVTITNSLSSIYDDNDVWIYGMKGVIPILYSGHHYNSINLSSIIDYYEVEPWNRSTIRWSFADYNSSGTETSAHRFNSGNCWPKTDEAKWMIGNLSFSRLDFSSHRVMQGSWGSTNRQYDNDTVWALAAQLGSEEFFSGIDDTSTDLQAGSSAVCSASQIPFILPKGCFVRLRCVFQDGFFFWEPIAMGSIDKN